MRDWIGQLRHRRWSPARFLTAGRRAPGKPARAAPAKVLFLGNSHLSAFKLAYDDVLSETTADAMFFCARGADLFFTDVSDGKIKASRGKALSEAQLRVFYGVPEGPLPPAYPDPTKPMADVAAQFTATGGTPEIDLHGVSAIFYVVGPSPYDLLHLGAAAMTASASRRHDILHAVLDREFVMRRQIEDIRRLVPECRHYLIGRPLAAPSAENRVDIDRRDVVECRATIHAMRRDFLFDGISMPPDSVLEDTLLATRPAFCVDGRQESEIFQRTEPTRSDSTHMNRAYGSVILQDFVLQLIDAPQPVPIDRRERPPCRDAAE